MRAMTRCSVEIMCSTHWDCSDWEEEGRWMKIPEPYPLPVQVVLGGSMACLSEGGAAL